MRGRAELLGLGLIALSCIARAPNAAPTNRDTSVVAADAEFLALVRQAQRAVEAERWEEARDLARRALALPAAARAERKYLAALHEAEGDALFALIEGEIPDAYQTALETWETIPGTKRDVARVVQKLAASLVFSVTELDRAEGLIRRAIALNIELDGTNSRPLLMAYFFLLDIFDQECRVAEARTLLETASAMVEGNASPNRLDRAHILKLRGVFEWHAGNPAGAIEWTKKSLAEFDLAEQTPEAFWRMSIVVDFLSDLELARANYAEARALLERSGELAARSAGPEEDWQSASLHHWQSAELHFAYEASHDAKLEAFDREKELVSAKVGVELFPTRLPPIEACKAEAPPRTGRLARYRPLYERAESCFEAREVSDESSIWALIRLERGKVVAAEVIGVREEPKILRCVADAYLGYEHPTVKYSEFDFNSVN